MLKDLINIIVYHTPLTNMEFTIIMTRLPRLFLQLTSLNIPNLSGGSTLWGAAYVTLKAPCSVGVSA